MSVATIRKQVSEAAEKLLPEALLQASLENHIRPKGNWRNCDCEWCATKREATIVIGHHWPRFRGAYVEDLRDGWRALRRKEYRQKLKTLKEN